MEKKLQLNQLGETLVHSRLDQEMRHLPRQILAANACYFGSADLQVGYHQARTGPTVAERLLRPGGGRRHTQEISA